MMGMVLTLLAAIGVSAWAQTAPPASQPTPGMHGMACTTAAWAVPA